MAKQKKARLTDLDPAAREAAMDSLVQASVQKQPGVAPLAVVQHPAPTLLEQEVKGVQETEAKAIDTETPPEPQTAPETPAKAETSVDIEHTPEVSPAAADGTEKWDQALYAMLPHSTMMKMNTVLFKLKMKYGHDAPAQKHFVDVAIRYLATDLEGGELEAEVTAELLRLRQVTKKG